MQIVHEEAHRLIQLSIEIALSSEKQASLSAHLKDCVECQVYAKEIKQVDLLLTPLLKRRWNVQPIPLQISSLMANHSSKRPAQRYMTIRNTVLITIVFAGFVFSAWQFILSGTGASRPFSLRVLPAPTPSMQSTSTESLLESCLTVRYTVQENDTLDSIARQFSISQEEIKTFNHLKSQTVPQGIELDIPICNLTPTGTVTGPATFTITYTPMLSPTTSTPGG